jgi:Trk K+ transport system NAD-binding subunit
MSDVFFLVLRRLRAPLILLIMVYSIATLGLTLIPGADADGNRWYMSFFHAFYFVSFMGTTIGFGEIPYPFSDAQRAWVLVCIYTSVIAWLYAIGTMLRLLQDSTFQRAIGEQNFKRLVKHIDQPFYIICGYGETGALINQGLARIGIQTVIVDQDEHRTNSLDLENLSFAPVVLTADSTEPHNLLTAGLNHKYCAGVIAVTGDDHSNLQIAVSCKLLNQDVPVICRSHTQDEANNMTSFGTDVVINPFQIFAKRLNLLTNNPSLYRIQNWFINQHNAEHVTERQLPKGRWIICGYGRLGNAIQAELHKEGIDVVIVDPDPDQSGAPAGTITGRGTEADTLHEAGILDASVIIAASDDDANNLSVLITAQQINKGIYTIGRVSKESNQSLFLHAQSDYIMRGSLLVANEALTSISRPLVSKFLKYATSLSTVDTDELIGKISDLTDKRDPITWRLVINQHDAPAIHAHLQAGLTLNIAQICNHGDFPDSRCLPLLLQRGGVSHLLPLGSLKLEIGDQLLVCGNRKGLLLPQRFRGNPELIDSLINHNPHHIPLIRWWSSRSVSS